MSRPWQDFPPRSSPYHYVAERPPDVYAGPVEYMEPGARGFLVNTLLGKEEIGIDEAIDLLRQATIKLYGGIKPRIKKVDASLGYVKIDFMDPESVTVLPAPEGEEEEENEKELAQEATKTDNAESGKQNGSSKTEQDTASEKGSQDKEKKGKGEVPKKTDEATSDKKQNDKNEAEVNQDKKGESIHEVQWMKSCYKFKAFRTEIRNLVFVKSNVPDPVKVVDTAMEIIIGRRMLTGDAVRQLLPVLGVCQNDYHQLEVMARRVLVPIFDESLEPKGFGVILLDRLSDPGADLLIETIRDAIWSINPLAWQASPLTEPDIVIRLEIVGKKLVLSCLTHFMRYRHYNPKFLVESGVGEAEDDDGTWIPSEVTKMQELIKAEREKRRELERQKEEENRKERDKRREEAEVRRRERIKEEKEREEKRREREREREKEREREREREKQSKAEKKAAKLSEKDQNTEEENKKPESVKDKEEPKEGQSTEQKTEEKSDEAKVQSKKSARNESPPAKKARVEESLPEKEDTEMEESTKEPEEGGEEKEEEDSKDKAATYKKGGQTKKGGARKSKK